MAASLQEQIDRLASGLATQAAVLTLHQIAIGILFATHPRPERLRAAFENAGPRLLDRALASELTDAGHAQVEGLYRALLQMIDIADQDR